MGVHVKPLMFPCLQTRKLLAAEENIVQSQNVLWPTKWSVPSKSHLCTSLDCIIIIRRLNMNMLTSARLS